MNICLIMDNPETTHHPVIALALQQLSIAHTIRMLDVRTLTADEALTQENGHTRADLYLLKSHASQALDVAHVLEQQGAVVVNSWASSLACQDRLIMTQHMLKANLPWPQTQNFDTLEGLLSQPALLAGLVYPFIIKSRYSHRGDLVAKVQSKEQLQLLAAEWSQEPVILQALVASDGWDIKAWVIDQHVFAARRRTPLEANASKKDFPLVTSEMPEQLLQIILEIGRVFHLHLYGVDLLMTEQGPMVVDINSFPGFRGVPDADHALVTLVERLLQVRSDM
ncbi:MAG: hypothetical protein PVS3B3_28320 [Ktedonobacteraceae bacterium]